MAVSSRRVGSCGLILLLGVAVPDLMRAKCGQEVFNPRAPSSSDPTVSYEIAPIKGEVCSFTVYITVHEGLEADITYFDTCIDHYVRTTLPLPDLTDFLSRLCDDNGADARQQPNVAGRVDASASTAPPTSGQASQGFVTADFNGDGNLDYAYFGDHSVIVDLQASDGSILSSQQFSLPFQTQTGFNHIIAADFNGDGNIDLAVSDNGNFGTDPGGIAILLGKGDGTFQAAQSFPAGTDPLSIAAADFNGDGKLDIAAADQALGTSTVAILFGNGDGTFNSPVTYPSGS